MKVTHVNVTVLSVTEGQQYQPRAGSTRDAFRRRLCCCCRCLGKTKWNTWSRWPHNGQFVYLDSLQVKRTSKTLMANQNYTENKTNGILGYKTNSSYLTLYSLNRESWYVHVRKTNMMQTFSHLFIPIKLSSTFFEQIIVPITSC